MPEQTQSPTQSKGAEYQRRHRYAVLTELRDLNDKIDMLLDLVQQQQPQSFDINAAKNILRRATPSMPVEGSGCAPNEAGTSRSAA
jgi:hypothetical protein